MSALGDDGGINQLAEEGTHFARTKSAAGLDVAAEVVDVCVDVAAGTIIPFVADDRTGVFTVVEISNFLAAAARS